MLEICSACGNREWDKVIDGNTMKWKFILMILLKKKNL